MATAISEKSDLRRYLARRCEVGLLQGNTNSNFIITLKH